MCNTKDKIKLTDTKSTKEDRERSKREDLNRCEKCDYRFETVIECDDCLDEYFSNLSGCGALNIVETQ